MAASTSDGRGSLLSLANVSMTNYLMGASASPAIARQMRLSNKPNPLMNHMRHSNDIGEGEPLANASDLLIASSNSGMQESTQRTRGGGFPRTTSRLSLSWNSRGSNYLKRPSLKSKDQDPESRDKELRALEATNAFLDNQQTDEEGNPKNRMSNSEERCPPTFGIPFTNQQLQSSFGKQAPAGGHGNTQNRLGSWQSMN